MSDDYHYDCRPYKVSLLTSPNSWVSGLYGLSERWLTSFKLCVGCWEFSRLDYSPVSPIIYHGRHSISRCIHFVTTIRSWYKRSEFGLRIAIFFSAATVSGAFGGLLAVCRLLDTRIAERLTIHEGCNLEHGRCWRKSSLVVDLQFVTPLFTHSLLKQILP